MIRHVVSLISSVCDGQVTVVTGHQREAVEAALAGLPIALAHNPDFKRGQKTSVANGLRTIASAENVMIALGDQPRLTRAALDRLIAGHLTQTSPRITIPIRGGDRGNPIIVPRSLIPRLLEDSANPGCHRFTRDHPELVNFVPLTDPGFFSDIDTPADFEELTAEAVP